MIVGRNDSASQGIACSFRKEALSINNVTSQAFRCAYVLESVRIIRRTDFLESMHFVTETPKINAFWE